jgi:hypothetical protein
MTRCVRIRPPRQRARAISPSSRNPAPSSPGDQVNVDFGDLLDLFAADGATRAIVLYVESIKDAR